MLWAWWQSAGVLVRRGVKRKQTQTLHGRATPTEGRGPDQQDQGSWEALCSQLCAASAAEENPVKLWKPWGAEAAVSTTLGERGPFEPELTQEPLHGPGKKLPWTSPFDTRLGLICELKAYLELHLQEEQERGAKADQKWPLFFFSNHLCAFRP